MIRQAFEIARPRPGGDDHGLRLNPFAADEDSAHGPAFDEDFLDLGMFAQRATGLDERRFESQHRLAVIHLVVERAEDPGGDPGREMGLKPARLGSGQPFQLQPHRAVVVVGEFQALGVVAVERDDQRALVTVIHRQAGGRLEIAAELGPHGAAFQKQGQQTLLARLGLDMGREHAGRRPGCAAPGRVPLEHAHGPPGPRQIPSDGKA